MGLGHSPRIITDGLVLALDAANTKNYNLTAVEVLVVAGGGGGGAGTAGGGGGGGVIYNSNFAVTPGSALTVTVGVGGTGKVYSVSNTAGDNGGNSVFGSLTATGGGGGGNRDSNEAGKNGGSGGGGGGSESVNTAGTGTSGQGFAGGSGRPGGGNSAGGGGGGAGGAGEASPSNGLGGNGGPGLGFNISGTFTYYGGGGGGGSHAGRSSGGIGGGGAGSENGPTYNAVSGTSNTGGGGGGGGGAAGGQFGGNGGSGIVIVRYQGPQKAIGGTITSNNGYTIHTFTTVETTTFTPLVATNNSAILGLSDFSGNNNFGTTANSPTYSSANGGSLSFDGVNDWFSTSLSSIGDVNTSFTWGGFAKINASTTSNFFLFGNYTESFTTPFFAIVFNNSGTNTFVWFRDSTGGTEVQGTSKSLSLNNWYYIIGVRDASANQVKLYVNGVLESTNTFSGSLSVKSSVNNFGGLRHLTNYLNANVSSVVVYNRALTAAEISQNFNALRGRFSI
jgi:hypothetical protein